MSSIDHIDSLRHKMAHVIRRYIEVQVNDWALVPELAKTANQHGHSHLLKAATEERIWTINIDGDYRDLLYVRCSDGEAKLLDSNKEPAGDDDTLKLLNCLEKANARSVLEEIKQRAESVERNWYARDDERAVLDVTDKP